MQEVVTLYAFINGGNPVEGYIATVLASTGIMVLDHAVATVDEAPAYIGIGSDIHHDIYNEMFGENGWTLRWVEEPLVDTDVVAAYALHNALGK